MTSWYSDISCSIELITSSSRCMKTKENEKGSLRWRHNERDSVSNHQPHDCLRNRLFRRRSKKTSKLRLTGLCVGKSPGTDEFPAQMASYAENVSIWWRHHGMFMVVIHYNDITWVTRRPKSSVTRLFFHRLVQANNDSIKTMQWFLWEANAMVMTADRSDG